jgi:NAD(P)-dependent dehydrogenase (short-subunit alcohol dehydrogenase family)
VVTGANDRGIGGAIAERLAREGARLCILSRTESPRLLKRLERLSPGVIWQCCDVTRHDDVEAAVAAGAEHLGPLDVLVNNAGVEIARPFSSMTDDEWSRQLETNLTGAMRVTRTALRFFSPSGGAIVNVASALALGGCAAFAAYSASKAGLIGMTQSLAVELAPRGIRANCVAPALVMTPMIIKHIDSLSPAAAQEVQRSHPLGVGSPHDVAAAVAFLASSEARWITGITLPLGWVSMYLLPVEQFLKD